jgi:tetratricopeptide (TPR) repeat protein
VDAVPLSSLFIAGAAGHALEPRYAIRLVADAAARIHDLHERGLVHGRLGAHEIRVLPDGTVRIDEFTVVLSRTVDPRDDVFSLGAILWELLTRKRLRRDRAILPPSRAGRGVPDVVDDACLLALAERPDERFQTADDLKKALEAQLGDAAGERQAIARYLERVFAHERIEDLVAEIPTELPPPSRPPRWKWIAGTALVVVVGTGLAMSGSDDADGQAAPIAPSPLPVAAPAPPPPHTASAPKAVAARQARRAKPPLAPPRAASPDALFDEGANLFVTGQIGEAKSRFRKAVEADPEHAPAHRALGLVYQLEGADAPAVREFERYLRLAPDAADADAIRGRLETLLR